VIFRTNLLPSTRGLAEVGRNSNLGYNIFMNEKLYHQVPKKMEGNMLFPLNKLTENLGEEVGGKLTTEESNKYNDTAGRKNLTEKTIPPLDNAKWNDVIHLTPIHPSVTRKALIEAGRENPPDWEYFEIDPHSLDIENTTVYLAKGDDINAELTSDDFTKFNPSEITKYSELPKETRDHYKDFIKQGKNPFLTHKVPHILSKTPIDISRAKKV